MKELLYWVIEKMLGKDIMHYKVNVQIGVLLVLVGVSIWAAVEFHSLYWQWNDIKTRVQIVPVVTSNIVTSVVSDSVGKKLDDIEVTQKLMLHDMRDMEADDKIRDRSIDRMRDYLFDKDGVKIDCNWQQQSNKLAFEP